MSAATAPAAPATAVAVAAPAPGVIGARGAGAGAGAEEREGGVRDRGGDAHESARERSAAGGRRRGERCGVAPGLRRRGWPAAGKSWVRGAAERGPTAGASVGPTGRGAMAGATAIGVDGRGAGPADQGWVGSEVLSRRRGAGRSWSRAG